jgi:hypothetical protein
MRRRALAVGALSVAAVSCLARAGPPAAQPGWVLHETHIAAESRATDTILTYVTPSRVRVAFASGDAILDVQENSILVLDRSTRTYRRLSVDVWAQTLEAAQAAIRARTRGASGEEQPRYEKLGEPVRVAGYLCDHYALYTRSELLPGEAEFVEQQIWVTRELELPGAYEKYLDILRTLESVGLGGTVRRPPGVVLAVETRTRRGDADARDAGLTERSAVFRVERVDIPDSVFAVPRGYAAADTARG